ncbi:MAG: maleylacetoacetate isomerase [Massilia sp.]|nr:maleylacetoacetate isomerase [Massilia sp.]
MQLHTFFRSSASYRVRIALNLKGIAYDAAAVHLSRNGGEQFGAAFDALNPQHLVPVLVDDGAVLTQSLAILEYIDETHPQTPLLPAHAAARARVRALSQMIACDIHPLNNLRVLNYLSRELQVEAAKKDAWYRHWVALGLAAFESVLARSNDTGLFCHGDTPGMADCCLIPQVFNAQRFECDIAGYPTLMRINDACMELDAFQRASPVRQPDAA